jgi:phosphoribosylformylglycinamidine synthase
MPASEEAGHEAGTAPLHTLALPAASGPVRDEKGAYAWTDEKIQEVLTAVLTDSLQEDLWIATGGDRKSWMETWASQGFRYFAEKQFAPGVTDNLAHTVYEALLLFDFPSQAMVASGTGYLFKEADSGEDGSAVESSKGRRAACTAVPATCGGSLPEADASGISTFKSASQVDRAAVYKLYHPIIEKWQLHDLKSASPQELMGFPQVTLPAAPEVTAVSLAGSDQDLIAISKDRLLALSLDEMLAIRAYFQRPDVVEERRAHKLTADPTDVELEVLAQTWSEHCKHKIFNATIHYREAGREAGKEDDGSSGANAEKLTINSLYKTYIQAPTKELSEKRDDLLSVFKDNSGVIRWDDDNAICFKVETHNSPSALEPYGGALTGILGVNRDILGTGLGARPIFNTDVFCFAYPSADLPERPKLLPATTILNGVRKGVEDGGNKSGIPTINGALFFDPAYRAKPLVFCGTGGILPIHLYGLKAYEKHTQSGDIIVMAGGRVGKDGVHGATFSSESLHEGSPVSAVQIGDPFTQKRLLDFVIEARDANLITGITDNGAGGLSSSIGEMAQITNGALLKLESVPTKYPGLADWEIVVSESQERMTLSTRNLDALKTLAGKHNVEISAVGEFNQSGCFQIMRGERVIALLRLDFLHDGCPRLELDAVWRKPALAAATTPLHSITVSTAQGSSQNSTGTSAATVSTRSAAVKVEPPVQLEPFLLELLAHPNICSREDVIRQYDHEVQGSSVIKPLMGAYQKAACDAAVITPIYGGKAGLAVSNGMAPRLSKFDTELMAKCAVDEAVRNAVCVGADPKSLALLDNFCWPDPLLSDRNPDAPYKLAQLVRACMGLKQAVEAYGAPLISGKDSMKNDFDDGVLRLSIPPTLLVSAIGRVHDVNQCISMDFKQPGDLIYWLSAGVVGLGGSHYAQIHSFDMHSSNSHLLSAPTLDLQKAAILYDRLHSAIQKGLVQSAHDLSEGGFAVAAAECVIANRLGAEIDGHLVVRAYEHAIKSLAGNLKPANRLDAIIFGEGPANLIVSVRKEVRSEWEYLFADLPCALVGYVLAEPKLRMDARVDAPGWDNWNPEAPTVCLDLHVDELTRAWSTALPFD